MNNIFSPTFTKITTYVCPFYQPNTQTHFPFRSEPKVPPCPLKIEPNTSLTFFVAYNHFHHCIIPCRFVYLRDFLNKEAGCSEQQFDKNFRDYLPGAEKSYDRWDLFNCTLLQWKPFIILKSKFSFRCSV